MAKAKAKRGRYCWSCEGLRPSYWFSRRSARRRLCRECLRLGPAELEYRQAVIAIDRMMRHGDTIPKRHRKSIELMTGHENARVRAYVAERIAYDARERREFAELRREDDRAYEEMMDFLVVPVPVGEPWWAADNPSWMDDDLPFEDLPFEDLRCDDVRFGDLPFDAFDDIPVDDVRFDDLRFDDLPLDDFPVDGIAFEDLPGDDDPLDDIPFDDTLFEDAPF